MNSDTSKVKEEKPKKSEKEQKSHVPHPHFSAEAQFFAPRVKTTEEPNQIKLQEIPKEQLEENGTMEISSDVDIKKKESPEIDLIEIPLEDSNNSEDTESKGLKEIKPTPFRGSIISSKEVYGSPKSTAADSIQQNSLSSKAPNGDDALYKRKRLEEDMTHMLGFISQKLKIPEKQKPSPKPTKEKISEKIPPASMEEILKQLIKLDSNIEASAIIKSDGTILASAISNRISNSLFTTIGMNLSMIGNDIIDGLSAGKLRSISVRGTSGVLDLAPVETKDANMKGMILIIFSNPRIKSGIISMAVSIVKKQIIDLLS